MRTVFELHRTPELDALLEVVDRVYAAACAEMDWHQPLKILCGVGNFGACVLMGIDPLEQRTVVLASHGLAGCAPNGAGANGVHRNPLLTDDVLRSPPGTVWHDRQIISPARLASTSFWAEWMQPNDFKSWLGVVVGRMRRKVVCLEVFLRSEAASSPQIAVDLLARLAPHLTRAWRLAGTAQSISQQAAQPRPRALLSDAQPSMTSPSQVARMGAAIELRTAFGLSKAEARLSLRLASGASLASAAKAFDVKLTTIRSQLQQVFSKTGTSRQSELVALLLNHGYVTSVDLFQQPTDPDARYELSPER